MAMDGCVFINQKKKNGHLGNMEDVFVNMNPIILEQAHLLNIQEEAMVI